MFLAESSHSMNMKKPESELHSSGEQQGEEPGCTNQPPPATLWIEMRSHGGDVYAWRERLALITIAFYMDRVSEFFRSFGHEHSN